MILIYAIISAFLFALFGVILNVKDVGGDEHYGNIGFGSLQMSAADAFSIAKLPALAEPTLIVDLKTGAKVQIDVKEILVWDLAEWFAMMHATPTLTGLEDLHTHSFSGITKDNTAGSTDFPTSDLAAQGTQPGGRGTVQVGDVAGLIQMIGETAPRFEARFEFTSIIVEENAAGEIVGLDVRIPVAAIPNYFPYEQDGVWVHHLLTAAHYWYWMDTSNWTATGVSSLGGRVKKVAIDVGELLFDREVLFSLVDALAFQSS